MKRIAKKSTLILLVFILTFSVFSPLLTKANATTVGSRESIVSVGRCDNDLITNNGGYVGTEIVGYYRDGNFYPAYCLNRELDGVGELPGYDVTVDFVMQNDEVYNRVWRVMMAGYPYKTPAEMGVYTWQDAYQVTKMAIYCVTGQTDINRFPYDKQKTAKAQAKVNAINNLYNEGMYGTSTYLTPTATLSANGELTKEIIGETEYYVQNYDTSSINNGFSYNLSMSGFPDGTLLLNTDNQGQTSFTGNSSFKVAVPTDTVKAETINGEIWADATVKTYPIMYGRTTVPNSQNYCLASDPFETLQTKTTLKLSVPDTKIVKIERGTEDKLPGAEYNIYKDENENGIYEEDIDTFVVSTDPTNENGETIVKGLNPGKYISVETVAPEGYNLDSEDQAFEIEVNGEVVNITSSDTVITSTLKINKIAKDDNQITGDKKGDPLANAKFNIYDINHKILYENATTDENGQINVVLRYGKYIVEEVRPPEFYLLNEGEGANEQIIEVHKQGELIPITFEDEAVKLGLVIEKTGIVQCQANDEILYDFPQLKNNSNVSLDDFVWSDVLPTEYIRATKLYTGTYNEDLRYEIYYKTNLSGDEFIQYKNEKEEDGKFSTLTNNYIDLAKLNTEEEYVTEWKVEFGTVKAGFEAVEKPFMFAKVNSNIKADDKWTNHTFLTGNYTSIDGTNVPLGSKDDWTTTSYSHSLSISKLPKTGF